MSPRGRALIGVLGIAGIVAAIIIYASSRGHPSIATPTQISTAQYQGAVSLTPDQGHATPLPSAQDRAIQDSMTVAGTAMIQAAQSMEAAAAILVASGNQTLVDLGGHWQRDAQTLRDRGTWMNLSATSAGMIHDPNTARELDLANLQVNGEVMAADGNAMVDHGRAMIAQVDQLRTAGSLTASVADDLTARGQDLITTGEQMASDGKKMQEYAKNLLQSLGE